MDLSLCAPILGTDIGFCSLMTRLAFAHSTLSAPRMKCLRHLSSTRLGQRHSLVSRSSVCVMTRVGNTCPGSLRLLQIYMELNANTLFVPVHNRMELPNAPIVQLLRPLPPCSLNPNYLHRSGEKHWLPMSTSGTAVPLILLTTLLHSRHGMEKNRPFNTFVSGAA